MNKILSAIAIIFVSLLTSCMTQRYANENYEVKMSNDLSNDIEKYGKPNKVEESTAKGYYVKTCTWYNVNGQELSCDYSSIGLRTCTRGLRKGEKSNKTDLRKGEKSNKTDYERDIAQFGYPDDVSTYSSGSYYSKTCTWDNACGKYRSYDYDRFGKRTSKFESNPIR